MRVLSPRTEYRFGSKFAVVKLMALRSAIRQSRLWQAVRPQIQVETKLAVGALKVAAFTGPYLFEL